MAFVSSTRESKRKLSRDALVSEPPSKSSKVTMLSPTLLLLEIPADTNTSLPAWEALRSQQVNVTWTINPYSIGVHLTPVTSATSSRSDSTSDGAQTSVPSFSIVQPQMVVQSINQLNGVSQNASCVTVTENITQSLPSRLGQPQKIPPTGNPARSLIFSLPVIITQPQPACQPSTTEKRALPAIPTPRATPTKLQAPSNNVPVPPSFHTRSSSDTRICDNFLLGLCCLGKKCKMHHTPYPFHWQLGSVITHRWVDIPPRSQVLLERLYCNVNQEVVSIKDGLVQYNLIFDTMELDEPSKYDGVRRLTNSNSLVRNPYFPSKWKIYWWNHLGWQEYNKNVSTWLLKNMSEKKPECYFYIGSQEYKLDFTTMTQINVTTEFQREVRCRPVYCSPDSMQPYLQTGIQTDPAESAGDPPGANFSLDPLKESSSWYPPVWCLTSVQDYSVVYVPAGTQAYRRVQNLFYESLPETKVDIISIQQIQNLLHWDKYQRHKVHMQKQHTKSQEPLERHLFHGTTREASEDICHNNFDPRMSGVNGTSCGFGSYFATTAAISNTFSAKAALDEVRHMFLAKVLVGKVSLGRNNYRRPPPLHHKKRQYRLYDSCVDDMDKPTMFVVFDSCQCYPYYLIKYKDLPEEIAI